MITLIALLLASVPAKSCASVHRDHEAFKKWSHEQMARLGPAKSSAPTAAERGRWVAFEKTVATRIDELNRRYAACQKN